MLSDVGRRGACPVDRIGIGSGRSQLPIDIQVMDVVDVVEDVHHMMPTGPAMNRCEVKSCQDPAPVWIEPLTPPLVSSNAM